jgi:hypothetical protein
MLNMFNFLWYVAAIIDIAWLDSAMDHTIDHQFGIQWAATNHREIHGCGKFLHGGHACIYPVIHVCGKLCFEV